MLGVEGPNWRDVSAKRQGGCELPETYIEGILMRLRSMEHRRCDRTLEIAIPRGLLQLLSEAYVPWKNAKR